MEASILNIVFDSPEGRRSDDGPECTPRRLASFYAELLGMRILREDWLVVGTNERSYPRLAFDDGPSEERPPRWPDPERPQQLHLDVTVRDLEAVEGLVLGLGAARLQDEGGYRSYADPAGHPFCLYPDATEGSDGAGPSAPGRIERVVFDCPGPHVLAAFYGGLLGMHATKGDTTASVVIAGEDGRGPMLAFQRAPEHVAPRWPDPMYPQQLHLDLDVDDGEAACALAERLGARRLPNMGGSCPVYADPAGHPFCLCSPDQ